MSRFKNILILFLCLSIIIISFLLIKANQKFNKLNFVLIDLAINKSLHTSRNNLDDIDSLSLELIKQIDSALLYISSNIKSGRTNLTSHHYSAFCMVVSYPCGAGIYYNLIKLSKMRNLKPIIGFDILNYDEFIEHYKKLTLLELIYELKDIRYRLMNEKD
jgi:hypothetical protein